MTHKEIAERLRSICDESTPLLHKELVSLADQLDPPRPEPGTVVRFRAKRHPEWVLGIVVRYGIAPAKSPDKYWDWDSEGLEWKPARILADDEVAVKVPPVSEWPRGCPEVTLRWHYDDSASMSDYAGVSLTRAEAEAMEAK